MKSQPATASQSARAELQQPGASSSVPHPPATPLVSGTDLSMQPVQNSFTRHHLVEETLGRARRGCTRLRPPCSAQAAKNRGSDTFTQSKTTVLPPGKHLLTKQQLCAIPTPCPTSLGSPHGKGWSLTASTRLLTGLSPAGHLLAAPFTTHFPPAAARAAAATRLAAAVAAALLTPRNPFAVGATCTLQCGQRDSACPGAHRAVMQCSLWLAAAPPPRRLTPHNPRPAPAPQCVSRARS